MKHLICLAALAGGFGLTHDALAQAASAADASEPKTRTEVKSETKAAGRAGQLRHPEDGALYGVTDGKAVRAQTRAMDRRSKAQEAAAKQNGGKAPAASAPN